MVFIELSDIPTGEIWPYNRYDRHEILLIYFNKLFFKSVYLHYLILIQK